LLSGGSALGVAGDFNLFVLGQDAQSNSDSEGRVAAGGNVNLTNYGIGSGLTNSLGTRDDLIVGGNLTYNQGQVFNGNLVYGGTAALTNVGLLSGTARLGTPLDFASAQAELTSLSALWAALAANGTTADSYGNLSLTGTNPTVDVFSVSADQLAAATSLTISAPASATALVNVSGSAAQMQNFGMTVTGTDLQHVLFNFPSATTLTLGGISVQGSVLAPGAAVTFNNGNLDGTLVAHSLTGSGEFHNFPTLAQVSTQSAAPDVNVTQATSTPAVSAGSPVSFTITVANTGQGTATGVSFCDALPAGLGNDVAWSVAGQSSPGTFSLSGTGPGGQSLLFSPTTLAAGASYSVTLTGTSTADDASTSTFTGTLTNTAAVTAANEAAALQNQEAATTVAVNAPDVTVTKTADQATITAGQAAGFTVTLKNVGLGSATGVTLSDPLPAGLGGDVLWSLDTKTGTPADFQITGSKGHQILSLTAAGMALTPGQSISVHLTSATDGADAAAGTGKGTLPNTATVSAANEAAALENQSASATVTVVAPCLTVTVAADQATVTAGSQAGYTVTISNTGAATATGVSLSNLLPAGLGGDVLWSLDTRTGTPADFQIIGSKGHQALSLRTAGKTLVAGQSILVHLTSPTSSADVGSLPDTATVTAPNQAGGQTSASASATVTIQASHGVLHGDFATIGFWHNSNGQALINGLNGGGSSTELGNWLATTFPHLYGASVDPTNALEKNLTNATNATVAGFFQTLFGASGLNKTYAQVLAVALGAYATSTTLSGGTYAQPYGFNVSASGTSTDTVNVGANGAALGLPNNSTQSVLALLQAADQDAAKKTLTANLSAVNKVFSGINQAGDIV
jgi:choice-of-anchor A domain-containing protein/uncharacterized repeat protein (TIGR01451 family)